MSTTTAARPAGTGTTTGTRATAGFVLLVAAVVVMAGAASAPSPFYPVLQADLGFSAATMTGIFAVYAIFLLVTLLFA
ncbi:MAG: transporter, partial [Aeromicrobium sp.]|nr:transporter [Aeromicrobium sp.]